MQKDKNKMLIIVLVIVAVIVFMFVFYKTPAKKVMPAQTSNSAASQNAIATVSISNFAFNSSTIQVKKGTRVVWTNVDGSAHTVTSDSALFNSPSIPKDGSYSLTFDKVGTYLYHCSLHPSMHGIVTVTQ